MKQTLLGLAVLWVLVCFAGPAPARAAELVMFEEVGCPWCIRWHEEVGPAYARSAEGKRAPLRVVDIHAKRPADLTGVSGVRATPTFVLMDEGREIGRVTGYPGADFFWGMLTDLMRRLPPPQTETRDRGAALRKEARQ